MTFIWLCIYSVAIGAGFYFVGLRIGWLEGKANRRRKNPTCANGSSCYAPGGCAHERNPVGIIGDYLADDWTISKLAEELGSSPPVVRDVIVRAGQRMSNTGT